MNVTRESQSTSLAELLKRRDQRLQNILKIMIAAGFLGVLSTLPSFMRDSKSAEIGLISFFALVILWSLYVFCFYLTRRGRHDIARNLLFSCWIAYAFVQIQLYSPNLPDPLLGILFASISHLFYSVVLIGIVTLDLWHRARKWLGLLCVSYVAASVAQLVRHSSDMAFPRFYIITAAVCFLLLICILAFARAFTSDLNQLLDQSEQARRRESELRHQTELARDQAMQASLIKSQFLANMSHELRTPLSAIIGYVELLREESEEIGVEEFDGDLVKIKGAATHLHGLINDILDLSKIEAGKLEIEVTTISLGLLLEEVEATVHPLMEKNRNRFVLVKSTTLKTFEGDEVRCKQVLLNLLSNASKFTQEGSVTLSVTDRTLESGDAALCFEVKDTGIGIDSDKLTRIFAPFEQADGSTTRKYGGTGLGLPISSRLVEMMGGELTVESEPGQGSTFSITLPLDGMKNHI